jgi:hypothetical protein
MKKKLLFIIFTFFTLLAFSQKTIYISPIGNDSNIGTKEKPLQSFTAALSLSRKEKIKNIIARGGKYFATSINLQAIDSGLIIKNYPHEKPTLYGGSRITKFYKEDKFICADLSNDKINLDFRMILVNDSLRDRSRLPEQGYLIHQNEWNVKVLSTLYGGWERKPTREELTTLKYDPKDIHFRFKDFFNAELTVFHAWDESYLSVQSVDTIQHLLHFSYPGNNVPGAFGNKKYVIWNTPQGVLHPGQWYWDKSNKKIYYWPKKGENIENIEMIIPIVRHVITFYKGAKNITIIGLTIEAATNQLQNDGFAAVGIDAAITGSEISHISLNKLIINHTGGNGINLSGKNISICDSRINAIGGGGIYFAGENIDVKNCTIENVGLIFYGAVGIYGYGQKNSIRNCIINNIPYSGICLHGDSSLIENCTIKYAMTFMRDGGAIYCGQQKNSIVKNNFILDNNISRMAIGIYFDEQSFNCQAINNVIINSANPVQCHMARNIIYENNLFLDANPQHIYYTESSDIMLNHNFFIAPTIIFMGPSIYDVKVDTITLDPLRRKFANPTGISSFKNNLIILTAKHSEKTNHPLPLLDKTGLSGTYVKEYNKGGNIDIKNLISNQLTKKYIDLKKLKMNKTILNEILKNFK